MNFWAIAGIIAAYEGIIQIKEFDERHRYYNWARRYCDDVKKPLLRIGMRRSSLEPPSGDVTLDLDPEIENVEGGVYGDVRDIPYPDKTFGVTFNEHVLEHLHTAGDVEAAISECVRVADKTVLLCPSPYSIYASLFCPTHNLRLWFDAKNNKIVVRPNKWRTGMGYRAGIGQAIVIDEPIRLHIIIG